MPWFIVVLISVAISAVAYMIMPHPTQKPAAVQDAVAPTADAGIPIPVIFGTMTIAGTNVLWWGDKSLHTYTVN